MPVYLTPRADEPIATKRVTHAAWDADPESANYEYIEILVFLRQEVLDQARRAGARQVRAAGRVTEELDVPKYLNYLFDRQVKGWRLLDQHGAEIPYEQDALLRLPWDVGSWLHDEVLACGGNLATRDLITEVDGIRQDYKSPDALLGGGQAADGPGPLGDGTLRAARARHRPA